MLVELVLQDGVSKLEESDSTLKFNLLLLGVLLFSRELTCRLGTTNKIVEVMPNTTMQAINLVDTSSEEVSTEFVLLRLSFLFHQLLEPLYQNLTITFVIHLLDKLLPGSFLDLARLVLFLKSIDHRYDRFLTFQRMFLAENCFENLLNCAFHVDLDVPELFIALVFEHFCEKSYLMVVSCIGSHSIDNRSGPFNDQRLQAVLLHEVCVHELFHCLHWET